MNDDGSLDFYTPSIIERIRELSETERRELFEKLYEEEQDLARQVWNEQNGDEL